MKRLAVAALLAAPVIVAQVIAEGDPKAAYDAAIDCAGRYKWLLDASSGGQPPINGYTLDERVKAVTTLEGKVRELAAPAGVSGSSIAGAILDVSDETSDLFLDDPAAVEAKLAACGTMAGIR